MTAWAVCALCAAAFGAVLKKNNRELSLLLTAGAAALLLLSALEGLAPLVSRLEDTAAALPGEYGKIMLKAVGIAVTGQFASHTCKDAGESALAFAVELSAKAAILAAAFPLITQLLGNVGEILGA